MVVTALGLLLGARADSGAVRTRRQPGPGRGRVQRRSVRPRSPRDRGGRGRSRRRRPDPGPHGLRPRAVRGPAPGERPFPSGTLASVASDLVVVHGQSDQQQLLQPTRQRESPRRVRRREARGAVDDVLRDVRPADRGPRAARRRRRAPPRAGAGGRPAALRTRRDRRGRPQAGRGRRAAAEESRLAHVEGAAAAPPTPRGRR